MSIVRDILIDEHSRPSKLVTEGAQKFGDFNEEGLKLWLNTIHEGFSPIIATGELDPDGNPIYMIHDYTDYHTASNLLWGRATQDRVTKAAGYELKRRETGQPPLGERQHDGVSVIDTLTCSEHQIDILDYAMHGPGNSPKERMLAAWQALETMDLLNGGEIPDELARKWREGQHLDPEVAGYNMFILNDATGDMEDFIQRYESNGERMATKEEKTAALQDALVDITRVAEKLLGIHDGTDLELPQSQR